MKFDVSRYISNFMKIRLVGVQLFYKDGRTDGGTDSCTENSKEIKIS